MSEFKDWQVTLTFKVPSDPEGDWIEAISDAAFECASDNVAGIVARGDTDECRVYLVFTVVECSHEVADEIARGMQERISAKVFAGGAVSIA